VLADSDWRADALDDALEDDGLPIVDEDGLDDDDGDWPSGLVELDGLVEDELDGFAPIAPAPPAGAASTVPVTVTL
jgi:hypothetical protein